MKRSLAPLLSLLVIALFCASSKAQVTNAGSISGSVTDPTGAVVAGATIVLKNNQTGVENTTTTSENGTFTIAQLPRGTYTLTVQATSGFKKSEVTRVSVNVGTPTTVNVTLEPGAPQEIVTIVGGGEILQTQTANVGNTITGRQITELPFTSRDALDLVLALPGTQTPARPRSSTVNGLPRGAITITMDGLPDQANDSKSNDGFFTFVRPRIDAIEEVTLSSAVPGAESSGDGAIQIKFSTKGGGTEYHGSGYWYHRNTALNANYYFNNISGQPRQAMILNQPGVRVGGPILIPKLLESRDKAFFFVNYEEFRLPGSTARQRVVLTQDAERGIFKYGSGGSRSRDLLALASANGQTATIDPTIGSTLAAIRGTFSQGGLTPLGDNQQRFTWNSPASQVRKFTSVRLDFNLTPNHHLDNVWNYNVFASSPDQLNSRDPIFPGLPIGTGGQYSDRFSNSTGLRSILTKNLTNELRFGIGAGGTVLFFPETNPGAFSVLGGFNTSFTVFNPGGNNTSSPASGSSSSRNNAPSLVLLDNLSYVKGDHSFNFGVDLAQHKSWSFSVARVVPAITFGLDTNDPASAMFTAANLPGASSTDLTNARNLYALLTGRVTTITASAFTSEETGKYTYLGDFTQRSRQRTAGFFVQDSWRFRPNLTINAGVRWELQFPFTAQNSNYTQATYEGVWGVSGVGNLFKPGTLTGSVTQFTPFPKGTHAYNTDWNNIGPSIGVAWSPSIKGGFLRRLVGESGQTVFRGGYSIAFVREGSDVFNAVIGGNPGGTLTANRSVALGNLTAGTLFRNPAGLAPPTIPNTPAFPITPTSNPPYSPADSANAFVPDLKIGYVQSWSFGIQRELNKDTVLEVRYVANRGTDLWHQFNLNETNITENGFLNEYKLAQANLKKNGGTNFRYLGPGTGTFPLPIIAAYFGGFTNAQATNCGPTNLPGLPSCSTVYGSANFASSTFINNLGANNANARAFAVSLFTDLGRRNNGAAAGLPANLFIANPNFVNANLANGGAFLVDNSGKTWYDSFQIELRRRLSRGLLVQGSYVFSKSLSNMYGTSGSVFFQPSTLRDPSLDKTLSPFDLVHGFKANWIWELPIGRGQWLASGANGLVNGFVGGWAIHGQARIQSGSTFSFGNVQLVGMTAKELQDAIKIRQDPSGLVFFLPDDIILNTRRAFNSTATGFSSLGAPTGKYIAPANSNGCIQEFTGQCGFSNLILHGPSLTRFDMSIVKKTRVSEKVN
ncbi:MAG TPA: carboxypeptidase regulatory-like domain-containing protein, partial [Pyrinomonadaceae bacterium]|nr:carboxypeptidase regulatory-like domain-containing protein [Pyrinomonadaceae bacterium]